LQTLEDGPFYVRSLLRSQVLGQSVLAMHESLSLQRFSAGWVQMMLPFRMPRRAH
jgi:carotenoid 1,2-hydratase